MDYGTPPELEALVEAIDALVGAGSSFSDAGSVVVLERELARLECAVSHAVAGFEQWGEWALDGAKTPTAWLATRCHLAKKSARAQLRRGKALSELPSAASAWERGEIGPDHIDALERLSRPATQEALARDEALLVTQATTMPFEPFCAVVAYWEQMADPDGAEEDDMAKRARRDVYLRASVHGMFLGQMTFDPISGTIVSNELVRLEADLFEADWAEAKARLGRDPRLDELSRTSAQRRADAMVEMAIRSGTSPADGRRPAPMFSVTVDYPSLGGRISELAGGQIVSPGALLPWLDEAEFERVVFAPGKRVEVSVTSRFFTGATRRAIELRDRHCAHPFCDLPYEQCQIDHIVPYGEGGLTTQDNGRVLCGFHNRLRNQGPAPGD
jgi:Domain of unknown function (DUF222)